jgi:uncharacterized protein YcbX
VTELWYYPIKSCAGTRAQSLKIDRLGFEGDRRWMVVSADGNVFQTQREEPKMALIRYAFYACNF